MRFGLGAAWRAAACFCLGLLSACGGGGGGDGDSGFSVSYDRSSVSWSFVAGDPVAAAVLQATGRGTPPSRLYVGATTPNNQPDPNISFVEVVVQGQTGTVSIHPNASLGAGTYRGTILLLACKDELCNEHVGGSPFSVSYTITVAAGLDVQPSPLVLESDVGTPVSGVVTVSLPPGSTGFTATPLASYLTVDQVTANSFRVTADAGTPGIYTSGVEVRSGSRVRTLEVRYTAGEVTLRLDKTSLAFDLVSGTTASATLNVTQLPLGASGFSVSASDGAWLRVSQGPGNQITAHVAALPSGRYDGSLLVQSNGTQVTVPVSAIVSPPAGGERTLSTALSTLAFAAPQGMSAASQVLGLVRPSWNDAVDVSIQYAGASGWLQYTTLVNGDLQFSASAVGQAKGVLDATVTLTGAYPSPVLTIPVRFTVGAGLNFPPPQFIIVTPTTPANVPGSFLVTADGPSTLTWNATACDTWLRLTRSTGVLGTALEYNVDVTQLRALPVGADLSCAITLTVQGPPLPPGGFGIAEVRSVIVAMFDPPRTGAAPPQVRLVPAASRAVEVKPSRFAPSR